MIQPAQPDLVTVNIDGRDIAVSKGTNVIEAAKLLAVDVPHYCYHSKLSVVGNCRMCLVEMGLPAVDPATKAPVMDPATGKQKVNWMPRPTIACATNASPGLHIRTTSAMVRECREGVMEFLLINHPLDCPICDQAGECKLQEQATGYGRGYSRYIEPKNVKPKRTQLGPRVTLDDERCILCSRCIRFCKEVAKDDVLGFVDRGSYSTLTCYPGRRLENNYSLNTVDICPVGALTSTDFRFKMRVWFLKQTNSIDTESSVGANTVVWSREGVVHRITPRRNDGVNDTWMADSGRLLYREIRSDRRLASVRVNRADSALEFALRSAAALFAAGGVAVVGSGRSSVEEQFLTRKLAEALSAPVWLVARTGPGDQLLLSADRNPNVRGALVTGLISQLPAPRLAELAAQIDSGSVKTVVSIGEDLAEAGLTPEQLARVSIVYLGTHANATSAAASIVLPSLTVFEKSGTFINQQFRLQKFSAAVPGPAGATNDLELLRDLTAAAGSAPRAPASVSAGPGSGSAGRAAPHTGNLAFPSAVRPPTGHPVLLAEVWTRIAAQVPALGTMTHANLPDTGLLIDGTPWMMLSFPEGETLHFKPAKPAAASPS